MTHPADVTRGRPRPWIAVVLSLLQPGLGDLYTWQLRHPMILVLALVCAACDPARSGSVTLAPSPYLASSQAARDSITDVVNRIFAPNSFYLERSQGCSKYWIETRPAARISRIRACLQFRESGSATVEFYQGPGFGLLPNADSLRRMIGDSLRAFGTVSFVPRPR